MTSSKPEILQIPLDPTPQVSDVQRSKMEDEKRLEILKQQRELERKEKERALWREASRMSNLTENKPQPVNNPQKVPLQPTKQVTGLFSKLKLGKFLE
jgi:hypothetical protein